MLLLVVQCIHHYLFQLVLSAARRCLFRWYRSRNVRLFPLFDKAIFYQVLVGDVFRVPAIAVVALLQ